MQQSTAPEGTRVRFFLLCRRCGTSSRFGQMVASGGFVCESCQKGRDASATAPMHSGRSR